MGDVVDCRKTSPRLAAIEKAQSELRQEFNAREKRKRELEFLVKGGNPLDFRLGRSDFVGRQSTSGAKLVSSPRGESVESSAKEADMADNLLLFNRERNAKRVANLEGSPTLSHGVKSQAAYARRNRSRKGRDGHSNKPSVPSLPELLEARLEEHAISSVSNSRPASPKVASDNHQDMEIDGGKTHDASTEMVKYVVQEGEGKVDDLATNINANTRQVADCADSRLSDLVGKGEASIHQEASENFEGVSSSERNKDVTVLDKDMNDENGNNARRETNKVHSDKIDDIVGVADNDKLATVKRVDSSSNEDPKELPTFQGVLENNDVGEKNQLIGVDAPNTSLTGEFESCPSYLNKSVVKIKHEVELSDMSNEISLLSKNERMKANGEIVATSEKKPSNSLGDSSHSINKAGAVTSTLVLPSCEPSSTSLCKRGPTTTTAVQHYATSNEKLAKKVGEDAILKQARTIEANLKRAVELPMRYIFLEKRMKCHWDFVLEEMAWMANDFMQERLWKTTIAAHICHQVASTSQRKSVQKIACQKQRNIARTLAISVMNFWHSADRARTNIEASSGMNGECTSDILKSCRVNGSEDERDQDSKYMEAKNRCLHPAVQAYAVRFIKYDNGAFDHPVLVEAPSTPDRIHDTGVVDMSWEDQLSEESFFYTVAPGSMQAYREAVESQWMNHKKTSNSVHPEDCDASICDPLPDGTREYAYEEEDDDETSSYYLPGAFEISLSSKFTTKEGKNSQRKSYDARICDGSSNQSYDPCLESTSANQGMIFVGKRPSNSLNVCSVPTKRVRTAARQRMVSPFSAGVSGSLQVTSKTDVSSGDTNCFQGDQISMHGESQPRKNMEVESTVDFEKHLPSDGNELSPKSSKKKNPKHGDYRMNITDSGVLIFSGKGSSLDQRLQVDSMVQHEQRDHMKKRLEGQHFESNGNIGIYGGQHVAKKPKLLRQLSEPSPDVIMLATGSMPSPVASQMSNMSNQNKVIKIIANRDRGKKTKAMKMAVGQSGPGIPWTNFEDQALVVLVHDMGPNWELVSDAINGTLQFKCIFRKPKDCKERHKFLIDKGAGDGADSAEDSGSSQSYPSTLPGIPKGSARQLFQRLQGPIEEDVLRTHFEKIILIGQQLHSCRSQKDKQEQKQIISVHSSHLVLPQTCPNGSVLMPLDLCDAISSSSDVLTLGYQGSHTAGAAIPNQQGSVSSVLSTSGANNVLQGSSGIALSSNLPSHSTPMNASARDLQRYCMPRTTSVPVDDHQRMQCSQMLSSRNVHQSSMTAPGALPVGVEQGVCMLPEANGVGMMSGRTIPVSGFQGPPGRLNMVSTGNMLTGSVVGMPNSVNVHPITVPCSVNSMMKPRDALQMLQPRQNTEDHRQMMTQVSQGNAQAVPPFSSISAPFSTATGLPMVQPYPAQQQQQSQQMPQQPHKLGNPNHPQIQGANQSGAQKQAYAILLAKERQHQQRMLPQQPYTSSSSMPPMLNSSQFQQQTQISSSVTQTSLVSQHNKQHMERNMQSSSGVSNPMLKQRQRPQAQQQQLRQHQQKQLLQQQAKHMKGSGRGTMMGHQNVPVDTSQISGLSEGTRNQVSEKPVMQQGPNFVSGNTGLDRTLTQSSKYNKVFSRPPPQSSKRKPSLPSNSVTCNQGSLQVSTNDTWVAPQQSPLPTSLPLANPPLQQQCQMNQNMQRMTLQQNRPLTSDGKMQVSADPVEVSQMVPASPLPQCEDAASFASATSFASQGKPEPSYDKSTPAPTTHLAGSPQENLAGYTSVPHSNDELVQRQFTENALLHGHGVGGQWQLQEQSQQQQQKEHQQQVQHRQTAKGTSYAKPSNSGPG